MQKISALLQRPLSLFERAGVAEEDGSKLEFWILAVAGMETPIGSEAWASFIERLREVTWRTEIFSFSQAEERLREIMYLEETHAPLFGELWDELDFLDLDLDL